MSDEKNKNTNNEENKGVIDSLKNIAHNVTESVKSVFSSKESKNDNSNSFSMPKEEKPRKRTKEEVIREELADFARSPDPTANKNFRDRASRHLTQSLFELASGSNPSAKTLYQEIIDAGVPEQFSRVYDAVVAPTADIVVGNSKEYILTNKGVVGRMNKTILIPDSANLTDMSKRTYIDTITLPPIGDTTAKATRQVEFDYLKYEFIPYYLSGKIDEVAAKVFGETSALLKLNQFYEVYGLLQKIYNYLYSLTSSSTGQHYAVPSTGDGASKSIADALGKFRDFIYGMYSPNTRFNLGTESSTAAHGYTSFTDAYNFVRSGQDLVFLCNYKTYNSIIKQLPFVFSSSEMQRYAKLENFIPLPETIMNNNADMTQSSKAFGDWNSFPSIVSTDLFFNDAQSTLGRVKGSILVLQKNAIKMAQNFDRFDTDHYPKNHMDVVVHSRNFAFKALKWTPVALFSDSALEMDLVSSNK